MTSPNNQADSTHSTSDQVKPKVTGTDHEFSDVVSSGKGTDDEFDGSKQSDTPDTKDSMKHAGATEETTQPVGSSSQPVKPISAPTETPVSDKTKEEMDDAFQEDRTPG